MNILKDTYYLNIRARIPELQFMAILKLKNKNTDNGNNIRNNIKLYMARLYNIINDINYIDHDLGIAVFKYELPDLLQNISASNLDYKSILSLIFYCIEIVHKKPDRITNDVCICYLMKELVHEMNLDIYELFIQYCYCSKDNSKIYFNKMEDFANFTEISIDIYDQHFRNVGTFPLVLIGKILFAIEALPFIFKEWHPYLAITGYLDYIMKYSSINNLLNLAVRKSYHYNQFDKVSNICCAIIKFFGRNELLNNINTFGYVIYYGVIHINSFELPENYMEIQKQEVDCLKSVGFKFIET